MSRDRSYKWSWHPDRPWDGHDFPLPPDGQLSTGEAAIALGVVDASSVRALIDAGALPAFRDGRRWRIRVEDVENVRDVLVRYGAFCMEPPPDHQCDVAVIPTTERVREHSKQLGRKPGRFGVTRCSRNVKKVVSRSREGEQMTLTYEDGTTRTGTYIGYGTTLLGATEPTP